MTEIRLISFVFALIFASVYGANNSDLISVVVIFRHGDRTPTKFAPLDPYKDPKNWPAGRGELTNIGIQQQYNLGKWLRQQYSDFLPSKYSREDIYVRSADPDRCLMSAASNLAGLYPPSGDQLWNPNLPWRPIPIHTVPKKEDFILQMGSSCPRYEEVLQDLLNTEKFKEIDALNSKLYSYLSKNLGVKVATFDDIHKWYDTLKVEDVHNFTLPNWTHSVYPQPMKNWTELAYQVPTYTTQLQRFGTGRFFDVVSTFFTDVITNSTGRDSRWIPDGIQATNKMVMFSGHQTNLCDITNTLEVYRTAPYASALMFELRNNTKTAKPYVKLLYKTEKNFEVLGMKDCGVECDLKDFLRIVEPLRLNDTQIRKECRATTSKQ